MKASGKHACRSLTLIFYRTYFYLSENRKMYGMVVSRLHVESVTRVARCILEVSTQSVTGVQSQEISLYHTFEIIKLTHVIFRVSVLTVVLVCFFVTTEVSCRRVEGKGMEVFTYISDFAGLG